MNKIIEKLPSFFYPIVWLLAIGAFTALIVFMYLDHDISKYISALAILLSAFLAALSVLKSIQSSKLSEANSALSKKKTNLIYIDFILLDIYRQIEYLQFELKPMYDQYENVKEQTQNKLTIKHYSEYLSDIIGDRSKQLEERRIQIEDKEILYSLSKEQRINVIHLCMNLVRFEQQLDHIKNSKNPESLYRLLLHIDDFFNTILEMIKRIKKYIHSENKDLEILSVDDYLQAKNKNTANDT